MESLSVRIELPSQVQRVLARSEEDLRLERGATVADAIEALRAASAGALEPLLGAPSGPPAVYLVFLNGAQVADAAEARLDDGDVITLALPISGGSGAPQERDGPASPARRRAPLEDEERRIYSWQLGVRGLGEEGQERLKAATVLVTRVGGVGGAAALQLAAAGVGRMVLAHAGTARPDDLNRQILMTHAGIGRARAPAAARRLRELNPRLEVEAIEENASAANAARLVERADVVVDCAPLFEERFALNAECVRRGVPLVECAMHELEVQATTIAPGRTPCLACLYPEPPGLWRREFPVIGAVAGVAGAIGAIEAIKAITGIGKPLHGRLLLADLGTMRVRELEIRRRPDCRICGDAAAAPAPST